MTTAALIGTLGALSLASPADASCRIISRHHRAGFGFHAGFVAPRIFLPRVRISVPIFRPPHFRFVAPRIFFDSRFDHRRHFDRFDRFDRFDHHSRDHRRSMHGGFRDSGRNHHGWR
jgi:hypothetical protein